VYAAATSGSVTALKDIVARKGVKALKRKDGDDTSCVHACAEYGHTEVLAYVYDVIDDFEFLRAADCDLRTPLHWAAWRGNLETVKFLAERENVNAKARTGFTPLHYASLGGFEEIVRVLIDAGAKVSLEDQNQQSPIDVAYRFNNEGIAKILEDRRIREIEEAKNDPVKARIEEMNIAAKGDSVANPKAPTCEQGKNATRNQGFLISLVQQIQGSNGSSVIYSIGYASLGCFAVGLSVTLGISIGVLTYNSLSRYVSNR